MQGATWATILSSAAELGIVTVGVTALMIGGDFDLSVGANFSFSALVMALLMEHGMSGTVSLIVALILGAFIGFMNGVITVMLDIPSFVATLGSWLVWIGITLVVTGGATITVFSASETLNILGGAFLGPLRWEVVWWFIVAAVMAIVLHRTPLGNAIFAVGGKPQAAKEAGVSVGKTRIINFTLTGLLAAFAGAVQLGHFQSMASSYGDYYQLYAIAAAVVGGTALYGGRGSIAGAVLGSLILSMLNAGLILSGISTFWYQAVIGVIVIAAVAMHTRLSKVVRGGGD